MEAQKRFPAALSYILLFVFVVTGILSYSPRELGARAASNKDFVVVVDPGHGYKNGKADTGAVAPDGTQEKNLNVQLAGKIATALKSKGFTVYSTLNVGAGIPNLIDDKKPNITLSSRAAASNAKYADLFIAVHHNSYGYGFNSASGTVVLYDHIQGPMSNQSRELARSVYNSVLSLGYTRGNRGSGVIDQPTTVLQENNAPAITLEAGFMTNSTDLANIKNSSKQSQMAAKVADSIESFLKTYGKVDNAPPAIDRIAVSANLPSNPKYSIAAYGVTDVSGVKRVYCDVYEKGKKSAGIKTVAASNKGNGKWLARVDVNQLFGETGTYSVDVTVEDNKGNKAVAGMVNLEYYKEEALPILREVRTSVTPATKPRFSVASYGVEDEAGIKTVAYDVYPEGKEYLVKSVAARNQGNGKWYAAVDVKKLFGDTGGVYGVDVYATSNAGVTAKIGDTEVEYRVDQAAPTVQYLRTSKTPSARTKFSVAAYGVTDESGVQSVEYQVYPTRRKSKMKTVQAVHKGNDKWLAAVNIKSLFASKPGVYVVDVYATDSRGNTAMVGRTKVEYRKDTAAPTLQSVNTSITPSKSARFSVAAYGVTDESGVSGVRFEAYPSGKRHIKKAWVPATFKRNDNKWSGTFNVEKLFGKQAGAVNIVDVYATDKVGNTAKIARTQVEYLKDVTPPTLERTNTSKTPSSKPKFSVAAYGVTDEAGIESVYYEVYRQGKKHKGSVKVVAKDKGENKWLATVDVLRVGGDVSGVYNVDIYATDKKGNTARIGRASVEYRQDKSAPTLVRMNTSATPSKKPKFNVAAYGVKDPSGVQSVQYEVYRKGKRHIKKALVTAKYKGNRKWLAPVDVMKLIGDIEGVYNIDVYATDKKGNRAKIGTTSVEYLRDTSPPTLQSITRGDSPTNRTSFYVAANGVTDESGVASISFKVYLAAKPAGYITKTYAASYMGDGKWRAKVSVKDFKGAVGVYNIEVNGADKKGNSGQMGKTTIEIGYIDPSQYKIVGESAVTAQQLYNYYVSKVGASTYPYAKNISLKKFCALYISESKRYGIKPEVAFAQMVHETNFLKFTGDVTPDQFNFAGIGTTGGGVKGHYFKNVNEGVRAQIQHLFAYASKDACPDSIVDPRFTLVTRGIAPTVELLAGKWATGMDYGNALIGHISGVMRSNATAYAESSTMSLTAAFAAADVKDAAILPEQDPDGETAGFEKLDVEVQEPDFMADEPDAQVQTQAQAPDMPVKTLEADSEGYGILGEAGTVDKQQMKGLFLLAAAQPAAPVANIDEKVGKGIKEPEPYEPLDEVAEDTKEPEPSEPPNETSKDIKEAGPSVPLNGDAEPAQEEASVRQAVDGELLLRYGITLDGFLDLYFEECAQVGVKPEVAFLQAMKETDFLTFAAHPDMDKDNMGGFLSAAPTDIREGVGEQVEFLKCLATGQPLPALDADEGWSQRLELIIETAEGWTEETDIQTLLEEIEAV